MSTGTLTKEDTILFARQLALAINSDIPLTQGLELIGEKTDNVALKDVLVNVVDQLNMGEPFSDAINKYENILSPFFVQMIIIGEQSGTLPEVLEQIAASYEKQLETSNKLKSALTYPIILSILMFGVIVLLVVQVMPMFNDVLASLGGEMPLITRVILSVSLFIRDYFIVIIGIVLILIVGFILYSKTEKGSYTLDRLKFKLPIQKDLTSSLLAARFARNLGILIQSGMNFQEAFELIKPTMNNEYAEDMIEEGIKDLNNGEALDEVIEKMELFPWLLMKLFAVAARTGQMDKALKTAAVEMEKEVDNRLTRLTTVVEPVLIIILSLIVGVILISVVLPVVNIMNSIG